MKRTKYLFSVAALALVFTACKHTEFKKTKEGFPYKVFSSGSGEKVLPGYFVSYYRTDKINDSVLQTSYGNPPMFAGIPKDSSQPSNQLAELFVQARKGDSIQLVQSIDTIIKKNQGAEKDPFLLGNKGKSIVTVFKIAEVYKSQEEAFSAFEKGNIESFNKQPEIAAQRSKDEAVINDYLKAHQIQTQRTPWGAYVEVVTPGAGPKPKVGQFAMLRYTGKDLNGNVFDASSKHGGQLLPLQVGANRSIPGFEDGVKQLSKGAKANIYIPSVIGYGTQGSPPTIQPNQNLVFEVEVVDITDHMPVQAPPAKLDSAAK